MSISNCASCGADSRAAPITGIVTRQNPVTKQDERASVRPNGQPPAEAAGTTSVTGVSLSSSVYTALLAAQQSS
jgi:hypothetical protein